MERGARNIPRKRKPQIPEEDEKQNESILEEVLSISGKSVDAPAEKDESPPARLKRSASKTKDKTAKQKKLNTKKRSNSSSSLPSKPEKSAEEEKETNVDNETKASVKGDPVPNLPDGWRRQIAVRRSGKSAGQLDIYFYSPEGTKLRSRPDVASYLAKHKIDLKVEQFDFSKTLKVADFTAKKKAIENTASPKKKSKTLKDHEEEEDGVESKKSPKVTTSKKSSSKVPPAVDTEEKKDADGKSNSVLIKILESKRKRPRK